MKCNTCGMDKPDNFAKNGKIYKSCKDCQTVDKEKRKKRKEEKIKDIKYDVETEKLCNKCTKVFKKYETDNKKDATKCHECYKKAAIISANFDERRKEKRKELLGNIDLEKHNICSHLRCLKKFDRFKNMNGVYSEYCKECCEKDRKRNIDNPERREIANERKRQDKSHIVVRAKKFKEKGEEAVLKDDAQNMRRYRQKKKEKVDEIDKKSKEKHKYQIAVERNTNNIKVNLNEQEYYNIIKDNTCTYCGTSQDIGVDRVDSSVGYEESNCVPCCTKCNLMKNKVDVYSFVHFCKNITKFKNLTGVQDDFEYSIEKKLKPSLYSYYTYSSKKRNKEFQLTKEQFQEIIENDCYLCGNPNSDINNNGIDRLDNEIGYILGNCRPCCSSCNYMKRDYRMIDFLSHVNKIYDHCYENFKNIKCKRIYFNESSSSCKVPKEEVEEKREKAKKEKSEHRKEKYNLEKAMEVTRKARENRKRQNK